jgi:hypothetical protein
MDECTLLVTKNLKWDGGFLEIQHPLRTNIV